MLRCFGVFILLRIVFLVIPAAVANCLGIHDMLNDDISWNLTASLAQHFRFVHGVYTLTNQRGSHEKDSYAYRTCY